MQKARIRIQRGSVDRWTHGDLKAFRPDVAASMLTALYRRWNGCLLRSFPSQASNKGAMMMTVKFTAPILALGLLAGSAIVPASAEDAKHPPTNRVGEEVPKMTKDTDKDKHAPTNRVGEAVPTMTTDETADGKDTSMDDESTSKQ